MPLRVFRPLTAALVVSYTLTLTASAAASDATPDANQAPASSASTNPSSANPSRAKQALSTDSQSASQHLPDKVTNSPALNSRLVLFGSRKLRRDALQWMVERNNTDMVAPLIYGLRHLTPNQRPALARALRKLTGQRFGDNWFRWVEWQQTQPQITPFEGFDAFLVAMFGSLDANFRRLIYPGIEHRIRLEEIVWGGTGALTGIPPLNHPPLVSATQAKWLSNNEPVFGVAINGDVRAYPYRIMDWHEMLNDTVGGVPVTLAYCTLCGAGILYEAQAPGLNRPLKFGSSGLLYRSYKLMFDTTTLSLWNQFSGEPVAGKLAHSGLQLKTLPLVTTSWGEWRRRHPATRVLNIETGFNQTYRPGEPYGEYFKSAELMFPAATSEAGPAKNKTRGEKPKSEVFVLRIGHQPTTWPLQQFKAGKIINTRAGALPLVLIGDAGTRTVRAFRRENYQFEKLPKDRHFEQIVSTEGKWRVTEAALIGPNGEQLTRLPGHLSYHFALQNHKKTPTTER